MATKQPELAPAPPEPTVPPLEVVITTDEYAGQGGSYVFDPKTGKRTPAKPE